MRLRDTSFPLLLAVAAGACILLTPSQDAGYAVITFDGMKPVMSASASLVAAGSVFSLLVFPFYVLGLGLGFGRDRKMGAGVLFASSPVESSVLLTARMLSNAVLVILFSLAVLVLVAVVVTSRLGHLPSGSSLLAYLLIVIPAGFCSLPAAALLDRYLADRDTAKAGVAIAVWTLLMLASLMAWPDVFGLLLLRQNGPAGLANPALAMGIIAAPHMRNFPWQTVNLTAVFVAERLRLIGGLVVTCGILSIPMLNGLMRTLARPERGAAGGLTIRVQSLGGKLIQTTPRKVGITKVAFVVSWRWLLRARWTWVLMAASLAASIALVRSPRVGLAAALLVPLSIINGRRMRAEMPIRDLELSTYALWRPAPSLFAGLTLSALTAVPVIPILATLQLLRSMHVLVAMIASALWLTWMCASVARPLLGISVYTLAWYISSFSDIPATADLLGVSGTAAPSFAAACGLAFAFGLLLFRKDFYGHRISIY